MCLLPPSPPSLPSLPSLSRFVKAVTVEMQGGFSIREYASRMRSRNVANCWPFDETVSEETVKSLLPPITVKKFTWWLDELEHLRSESAKNSGTKKKKKKKKKKLEKGETSFRNEDQDMDESEFDAEKGTKVVKVKSLKGKMKAPKKRSIVEIFAVAPPVERAVSDEEEAEEEGVHESRKKMMSKKDKDVILRKTLRIVKKIKKKKAHKHENEMGQSNPNKDNSFKLKSQAQDKATGNPSSSCNKESEHSTRDCLSSIMRKPSLQHIDSYKKAMSYEAFNLSEENQHPGLSARGILENNVEVFSGLKQSTKRVLREAVQVSHGGTQQAKKHSFSEKEEILGQSRKPSQSVEHDEFQKVCGSVMGNIGHTGGIGKDSTVVETSGSEDASVEIRKEVDAETANDEQLTTCIFDSTAFIKWNNEEHSRRFEASEKSSLHGMNQDWSTSSFSDELHTSREAPSRFFCVPPDAYYNNPNIKVLRNSSNSTCRTPGSFPPSPCFDEYLRTYDEPPVSHLSDTEKIKRTCLERIAINSAHSIQFKTIPHPAPQELLRAFYSLPDESPNEYVYGRSMNGIYGKFVGLPLNSQGEFINLNSNAKREVNQMVNYSSSAAHSISLSLPSNAVSKCLGHHSEYRSLEGRTTSSMNQLNLFPVETYAKENPRAVICSRLGMTETQRERKTDLGINYHSFQSKSIMEKGKSPENEKIHQSRMRLMGKEFEVGGGIWKDKQIIDELHHFGDNSTRNVVHDQNDLSSRKFKGPSFCTPEITINHLSESKYALPQFDHQNSLSYPSVYVARKIDPVQRLSPGTYSEVCNESVFSEPYAGGQESRLFTLEPNMNPSAMQLKNKHNLPTSPVSAIRFPFLHPDLDGHAIPSWSRRSSLNWAPFGFDVSEKAVQLSNSQSCSVSCNHPYPKPGSSHGTDCSAPLEPDDFHMFFPLSSGSASQRSAAQTSLAPMPYYPGILMQKRHGNQKKFTERIKTRIGVRALDHAKKSKTQPSALTAGPFKPLLKMPTLGSAMRGEYETKRNDCTRVPWADSRMDTARTGNVKLSGGARQNLSGKAFEL